MIRRLVLLQCLAAMVFTGFAQVRNANTGTNSEEIKSEVLHVEDELDHALLTGDSQVLDRILADTFLYVGTDGEVNTKGQRLTQINTGLIKYDFIKNDDVSLAVHGDTVVLSGRSTTTLLLRDKGSWGKGGALHSISPGRLSGNALFSHVYVKVRGRWQLVLDHVAYITEK